MLDNIVEMGIDLAIDDFGTGYSSLSYLTQLPAKYLKIDRKFVDALDNKSELSRRGEAYEIVKAAITLSHSLKMQVVAEGIETSGQLAILQELSCDFLQGYFISRPLFPKAAEDFLCSPED
jgi:EAL domain-containing protein (putative c-di-GMP-specific phosphodiesterase class I)